MIYPLIPPAVMYRLRRRPRRTRRDGTAASIALVRKAINRSKVLAEVYPGAANESEAYVQARGGWVCEQHPEQAWPHGDCAGPGMLRGSR